MRSAHTEAGLRQQRFGVVFCFHASAAGKESNAAGGQMRISLIGIFVFMVCGIDRLRLVSRERLDRWSKICFICHENVTIVSGLRLVQSPWLRRFRYRGIWPRRLHLPSSARLSCRNERKRYRVDQQLRQRMSEIFFRSPLLVADQSSSGRCVCMIVGLSLVRATSCRACRSQDSYSDSPAQCCRR